MMPKHFMMNGNYFETITDIQSWSDSRVAVPQRPAPHWQWDGSQWVDPGVPVPTLQEQRDAAVLDKTTFCKQLRALGVLPIGEASAAARGEWPATFAGFTAGLTPEEAEDAQIEWAGAMNIHYTHPLLQALALSYANGDQAGATAILDQIFGIA